MNRALLVIIILIICFLLFIFIFRQFQANVALIKIEGEIGSGRFGLSEAEARAMFEEAKKDWIKAIIVEINSPGGDVVTCKRIIELMDSIKKPKVCLLDEMAASGAYWIASHCDYIIADNFTITASIGASMSYLEFSGLMEKYGVGYVRVVSGEEKDVMSPFRKPSEAELKKLKEIVKKVYDAVANDIAMRRGISKEKIDELNGTFLLGDEALKLGLIDEIGNLETAKERVKELANLTYIKITEIKPKITLLDLLSYFLAFSQ